MPGLLPFTTVEYEEPLADKLYDAAILHGWLSCMDRLNTRRRERWCALHQNVLYEFEPQMGEMLLRAKHNLEGCVCYVPGDSNDTFVVRTAGLFSTFGTKTVELEISYTVDDPSRRDMWTRAIALSSVMQLMQESKRVPHLIQQAMDAKEAAAARKAERRAQRQFERGSAAVEGGSAASVAGSSAIGTLQQQSSELPRGSGGNAGRSIAASTRSTGRKNGSVAASVRRSAATESLSGAVRPLTAKERARMGKAASVGSSTTSVATSAKAVSLTGVARRVGAIADGGAGDESAVQGADGTRNTAGGPCDVVKGLKGVPQEIARKSARMYRERAGAGDRGRESDTLSRDSTDVITQEASDSLAPSTPSSSRLQSARAADSDAVSEASSSANAGVHTAESNGAAVIADQVQSSSRERRVPPAPRAHVSAHDIEPSSQEAGAGRSECLEAGARQGEVAEASVTQVPLMVVRESLRKVGAEKQGEASHQDQAKAKAVSSQSFVDESPLRPPLARNPKRAVGGNEAQGAGQRSDDNASSAHAGQGRARSDFDRQEGPPVPPRRR